MKLKLYQVDAFTDTLFKGNPAAVCPLKHWLDNKLMQNIAAENNLAETAFYVKEKSAYRIRWFTPLKEVILCGHATLATAHVLFNHEKMRGWEVTFKSKSGLLKVKKGNNLLTLDFPTDEIKEVKAPQIIIKSLGKKPVEAFKGKEDFMFVYGSQKTIEQIKPDFKLLAQSKARGLIITAPGNDVDFVSRFFAPLFGIDEDPVTGSAHTSLTPYWSGRLGENELTAIQLSERQGKLFCSMQGKRVKIAGKAKTYLIGEINV